MVHKRGPLMLMAVERVAGFRINSESGANGPGLDKGCEEKESRNSGTDSSQVVQWLRICLPSQECVSHSIMSDSFVTPWTVACQALLPWDFPGKNTGVGSYFLLQGLFPTQ